MGSTPPTARPAELLHGAAVDPSGAPLVVMHDGRALVGPSNREVAEALGVTVHPTSDTYHLTIVGGGPAGLAGAVYGGSEGLRTALIEGEALSGQAGTSSMIRNYLGFPRGVSGSELAARAVQQAQLFGAELVYRCTATALRTEGELKVVTLSDAPR